MRIYLTCNIYVSTRFRNKNLFVIEVKQHLFSPKKCVIIIRLILQLLKGSISINGPNYAGEPQCQA